MDDKGAPLRGPDGRLVKGNLVGVFVTEKRAGWGADYPDSLRNGEWEYARFAADGQRQNVDTKPCFECHKPESAKDYVFTLNELRFRASLPQGTYQVMIPQLPIPQRTKDLPATVTISAGQDSRLDIEIDTGLRAR